MNAPTPKPRTRRRAVGAPEEPPEHAWERQPYESGPAYLAFEHYRDAGLTRSYSKTAEALGLHIKTVGQHGLRNSWVARTAAYDAHRDEQDRLWVEEERKKAVVRHVRQAQGLANKWITALANLDPNTMSPQDVIRWAEVATKLEREALSFEQTVHVKVSTEDLTDAALALSPEARAARRAAIIREMEERVREMKDEDGDGSEGS